MEKRELICVACPLGCPITVTLDENGAVTDVKGNTCKRGEAYAHTECTNPTRMLTTTVRVEGGNAYVVPVKTANPIPKQISELKTKERRFTQVIEKGKTVEAVMDFIK